MPEVLLSGHGPGVRVSQQEETYKLSEDGAAIETSSKNTGAFRQDGIQIWRAGNSEIEKVTALLDLAEAA